MLAAMPQRALWPLVLLLSAAGILVGHDLSYRLAGLDPGGLHAYLSDAPQILLALLIPAVLVSLSASRGAPRPSLFALLGAGGFALMEHLERILQGQLPWLLTSTVFLVGLALQIPFGLVAWWLARTLAELPVAAARPLRLAPQLSTHELTPPRALYTHGRRVGLRSRGPPLLR